MLNNSMRQRERELGKKKDSFLCALIFGKIIRKKGWETKSKRYKKPNIVERGKVEFPRHFILGSDLRIYRKKNFSLIMLLEIYICSFKFHPTL